VSWSKGASDERTPSYADKEYESWLIGSPTPFRIQPIDQPSRRSPLLSRPSDSGPPRCRYRPRKPYGSP
jgi:hypothetical protein